MRRAEADELMHAYDVAVSRYRLAVRLGHGEAEAFAQWNETRERLIDRLCVESEVAA